MTVSDLEIPWPHLATGLKTDSIDLLCVPFREFDQEVHWEASIWFDPDSESYGVTFWEPDRNGRLPDHISDLDAGEAIEAAVSFVEAGGH